MTEPVDGPVHTGVEMGPSHGIPGSSQVQSSPHAHQNSQSQPQSHPPFQTQTHSHSANAHDASSSSDHHDTHPMNIDADSTEGPSPHHGLASANSSSALNVKSNEVDNSSSSSSQQPPFTSNQTVASGGNGLSSLFPQAAEGSNWHNANLAKRQGLPSGPMVPAGSSGNMTSGPASPTGLSLINSSLLKQGVVPSTLPSIQNPPTLLSTMSTLDTAVTSSQPNSAFVQAPTAQLTSPVIPLIPPTSTAANSSVMGLGQGSMPISFHGLPSLAQTTPTQQPPPTSEYADMKHPYQVEPINTTSVGISTIGSGHDAIPVIISTTTTTITTTTITPIDPSQVPSAMVMASAGLSIPNGQGIPFVPPGTSLNSLPFPIVPTTHPITGQPHSPTAAANFTFNEGTVSKTGKANSNLGHGPVGVEAGTLKKELEARGEVT